MNIREFNVKPRIPPELESLKDLAMNLWYSWNWEAVQLFIRLNPVLWEESNQNPVEMLGRIPAEDLEAAARDESFVANLNRVHENFRKYLAGSGWFGEEHRDAKGFQVAYFSCEYGIDEGLPIYSGGLGVLSGDHLKSASDIGLPLVGVGLLYQKGYFRQRLNLDGWQQELYPDNDWYNMPVRQEIGPEGRPVAIHVDMAGERVTARVWRVAVGRTPLYLLDTNVAENSPHMRQVTSTLYGGDRDMRIRQEILLGIGGVRALKAVGAKPTVFHMNEGHSAFLALERIRDLMATHRLTFAAAREYVGATSVFTTHTPVPAGNEVFDHALVEHYLKPMAAELGLSSAEFLALGQAEPGRSPQFGMTVLALRTAAFANGVSRLHAETSRAMWSGLWPSLPASEVPITAVTNGIHTRTWISHDMQDLLLRYLGPKFAERSWDHRLWDRIERIPATELWRTHQHRKERLVFFVRRRLAAALRRQGAGMSSLRAADEVLDPAALTIGFSRRFATYKRAGLLFMQPERLVKLLANPERPVQIIFAGKAHPQDLPAKELIKSVVHFAADPRVRQRLVFVEDYDINVARYLVQGVDVWLNTPRRPLEASGTSGMKAAANGALNLSVLDGWWCEGWELDTGWAIGDGETYRDVEEQDRIECEALFGLLEREVVPLYYDRDRGGMPREWLGMMKSGMRKLAARFNTHRMLQEYTLQSYLPAHRAGEALAREGLAEAKALAEWRRRVGDAWPQVSVRLEGWREAEVQVGSPLELKVRARLGSLSPSDVAVEVWYGPLDPGGVIRDGRVACAEHVRASHGEHLFRVSVPCERSGRHGFAARVLPRHPSLVSPLNPLMITWE
ncbi:MAG: alpha-glucan family phosphorylase [Deltaproteobacteria bacterium]|nr:alpha-glucan family phosphorylase [Deltaproteobacteria bacterium]